MDIVKNDMCKSACNETKNYGTLSNLMFSFEFKFLIDKTG